MDLESLGHSIQLVNILESICVLADGLLVGVVLWQLRPHTHSVHFEAAAEVVDPVVDVNKISSKMFSEFV